MPPPPAGQNNYIVSLLDAFLPHLSFLKAYNWLRKSANLILNLLSLMSDAGISELSTDPVAVLAKVEERFRLDLTDEMVRITSFSQSVVPILR